jgi:hypothetical protein
MKIKQNSICLNTFLLLSILFSTASLSSSQTSSQFALHSKDGYVLHEGDQWTIGTLQVEAKLALSHGNFSMVSLRNKLSGHEYEDRNDPSNEIRLIANNQDISATTWQWTLRSSDATQLTHGELQLNIHLEASGLRVSKHYVVYPGTAVIREWLTLENFSDRPIHLSHVAFLHSSVLDPTAQGLQLNYLTGGGNYNGSQLLKTVPMRPPYQRVFDSNGGVQPGAYSSFLPLAFLTNQSSNDGIAVGWDYMGHWRLEVSAPSSSSTNMNLVLAGYEKDLQPRETIETPKIFLATFSGEIDDLGNRLLDWQYAYLWDFTNPDYFAKTRWAVDWPDPWIGDGGTPSADNWGRRLALDFRYVDLLRETGTDILWDDAGWYDKWGTWNGPDWRRTNDYLRKHDMRWALWYPTFLATAESKVAQEHPDWLITGQQTLEQSILETAAWQKRLLDDSVTSWGDYQWRYDIAPAASANDTDALAADQNFRSLMERFKSDHPQSAIDACDGGGRWISYDMARLAESGEYTDGGVGPYSAYYTSLLVPPDKLHNVVDFDHTYYNAASDRSHLAMDPTWYRDPGDGRDVEAIRKDWEIYHYLATRGVVGRWSHVFRPKVEHDDPVWYFQRMNRDGSKGVILTKHAKSTPSYYVISHPAKHSASSTDSYRGDAASMNVVATTSVASIDTGIYEDPEDGAPRFYGVSGETFGPLDLKYSTGSSEQSLVTKIVKIGAERHVTNHFFGMAFQPKTPMTITALGQFDPANNRGTYTLSLVRSQDETVLASVDLDMSHTHPNALGFKYAHLAQPIQLDISAKPIVIYPRGLLPNEIYDVRASTAGMHLQETGAKLMSAGIALDKIAPGELIFLNLPHYPGSKTDTIPPTGPSNVTKRLGANLGVQGIELKWSPAHDDNWISYYEIHKNGRLVAKAAKGTFFFDHSESARNDIDANFEITAVDGDGNRSPSAIAVKIAGEPLTYETLGDFSPTQSANNWIYQEVLDNGTFRELTWDNKGYEGRWTGSGLGKIGRIWMQPSAEHDLSRTFVVPKTGSLKTAGTIRKDPSAENQNSCFVRILKNDTQIWPKEGWAEVLPSYDTPTNYAVNDLEVSAGDKLRFELEHNGANRADPIVWDPVIVFNDSQISEAQSESH